MEGEGPRGAEEVGHLGRADERQASEELGTPHGDALDGPLEGEPGGEGAGEQPLAVLAGIEAVGDAVDGGRLGLHLGEDSATFLGGPLARGDEPLHQAADDAEVGRRRQAGTRCSR